MILRLVYSSLSLLLLCFPIYLNIFPGRQKLTNLSTQNSVSCFKKIVNHAGLHCLVQVYPSYDLFYLYLIVCGVGVVAGNGYLRRLSTDSIIVGSSAWPFGLYAIRNTRSGFPIASTNLIYAGVSPIRCKVIKL